MGEENGCKALQMVLKNRQPKEWLVISGECLVLRKTLALVFQA